jgi:hypothetical protein
MSKGTKKARGKGRSELGAVSTPRARGQKLPTRRPNYARTPEQKAEQQAKFLATLAETGNVRASSEAAGIDRKTAYEWREQDETFKALWKEALDNAIDLLEEEAWRRGYHGVDKPIVYKGKVTSTYKEYSDRMLEILLKAHRKKFRDKTEITGEDGGPISVVTKVERIIVKPPKREDK